MSRFEMRAFLLDGQVSTEWSRCPGAMGRVVETVQLYNEKVYLTGGPKHLSHLATSETSTWVRPWM